MPTLRSLACLAGLHARRVEFSPTGERLVFADDRRVAIYDRDGQLLAEAALAASGRLAPHVYALAWSPDDTHVVSVERDALRLRRAADLSIVAESGAIERRSSERSSERSSGRAVER